MRKVSKRLPLKQLELNEGQLGWLPRNPRQWTQTDIDRTKASITEDPDFLEDRPVLVTPSDKEGRFVVFAHNLCTHSAKELAWKDIPAVIYYPESDDDHLTIKRRAIKDNGSYGSNDYDILANEWDDMPLADWGLTGWEREDSQKAQGREENTAEDDNFDPDIDEIHVICKQGDIWQLGEHRLMCGDSTDLETVKSLMGGGLANMVFTDPPYGVAIGGKNKMLNSVQPSGRCCKNIENDTLSVDELYKVLTQAMTNVRECCREDACYFVASMPGGDYEMMMMMMRDAGLKVRHQIIWAKDAATFSLGRLDYDYQHEIIMYTWAKSHKNHRGGKFRTSVWQIPKPRKCDLHPTMKPVELVANCILDGSAEGGVVLDAFGGSGTTLIAAEQLGRRCYMMELDPHYCDVIIARWEKLTGKMAVKVATA